MDFEQIFSNLQQYQIESASIFLIFITVPLGAIFFFITVFRDIYKRKQKQKLMKKLDRAFRIDHSDWSHYKLHNEEALYKLLKEIIKKLY